MFSAETRRQAAAFDRIGERYDDAFPHKSGQIIATQWVVDRLAPGARVLDVGCGTGLPSAGMLSESGLDVVGIDVSTEMLRLARRNVPAARFVAMDVLELDESLGRFDAVGEALRWIAAHRAHGSDEDRIARVSGSGACVIRAFESEREARRCVDAVPLPWTGWCAESMARHPLRDHARD